MVIKDTSVDMVDMDISMGGIAISVADIVTTSAAATHITEAVMDILEVDIHIPVVDNGGGGYRGGRHH